MTRLDELGDVVRPARRMVPEVWAQRAALLGGHADRLVADSGEVVDGHQAVLTTEGNTMTEEEQIALTGLLARCLANEMMIDHLFAFLLNAGLMPPQAFREAMDASILSVEGLMADPARRSLRTLQRAHLLQVWRRLEEQASPLRNDATGLRPPDA